MKLIGKVLLTLLLLLIFSMVSCYFLLQTSWAAGWIGRWISDNSSYRLSLKKIEHAWARPWQLSFNDVALTTRDKKTVLNAQHVVIDLKWRQFIHLRHFSIGQLNRVLLKNGTLTFDNALPVLPFQADSLQLNNMTLITHVGQWQIAGQQVNAGFKPWQPQIGHPLGENSQFQLSANSLNINGIPAERIFVQGEIQNKVLTLSNFGASVAKGEMTGSASRSDDGSWKINQLQLSNIGLQTTQTVDEVWQKLIQLPLLTITHFDLINARLEGHNWLLSDLDLTLKNIKLNQGNWQSDNGELTLNAADIIRGDMHLVDPVMTLALSTNKVTINQFSTRWQDGLITGQGSWQLNNHRLQLDDLTIASLVYNLPTDWQQRWQQTLPHWLSEIYISKLMVNRNLLMDTSPDFPFQITSLDGFGTDLLLAQNHQWGIWAGKLKLNASDATFNKTDMRHLALEFTANNQHIDLHDLSAFTKDGLLEAKANIGQTPDRLFSLDLTGRSVELNILQNWGWPTLAQQGIGELKLKLNGSLAAGIPLKSAVRGSLQVEDRQGKHSYQLTPQSGG